MDKGSGYVINEETEDKFYLKRNHVGRALDGDKVKVQIQDTIYSYPKARIIGIKERNRKIFTARLYRKGNQVLASLYPYQAKKVILKNLDTKIVEFDLVVIEIIDWRENHKSAYAKLIRVISNYNDPRSDYEFVTRKNGIHQLKKKANDSKVNNDFKMILDKNLKNRIDLTNLETFTIDPKNAKDFDDAISIKSNQKNIDLFIHISDVSTFVQHLDKIDCIAKEHGNSYYFDEETTHMLPENLSTDICSLRPNMKRLAYTIKISIDKNFNITNYEFFESLIKSNKSFTYQEVENILQNKDDSLFLGSLKLLFELTKNLKKKRLSKDGFEMDYERIYFSGHNENSLIEVKKDLFLNSNMMVEECMLLANKLASDFMFKKVSNRYRPGIYRNHEQPSMKSINFLDNLMTYKSSHVRKDTFRAKSLNDFLKKSRSNSSYNSLCVLVMKKMKKANYSSKSLGHFGLGLERYTHFTSPIRRYSDLMVHRIMKGMDFEHYSIIDSLKNMNEGELRSQKSEREHHTLKSLRWFKSMIGNVLAGHIIELKLSKITVRESSTGTTGYILKKSLPYDRYSIFDNKFVMKGLFKNTRFEIGQEISMKIDKINLVNQETFFKPVF
tara:strand:+ start:175 stop:2013 length:1839 start_codon:yes stop_codon:yes gene_type:complete